MARDLAAGRAVAVLAGPLGAGLVLTALLVPQGMAYAELAGMPPETAFYAAPIDPALLLAPWPVLEAHVLDVIEKGKGARSHVLNLGHGVPPEADPDTITRVVSLAHGELDD